MRLQLKDIGYPKDMSPEVVTRVKRAILNGERVEIETPLVSPVHVNGARVRSKIYNWLVAQVGRSLPVVPPPVVTESKSRARRKPEATDTDG